MIWLISKLISIYMLINIININHISFIHLYSISNDKNIKTLYLYNRYFLFSVIVAIVYSTIRELHTTNLLYFLN